MNSLPQRYEPYARRTGTKADSMTKIPYNVETGLPQGGGIGSTFPNNYDYQSLVAANQYQYQQYQQQLLSQAQYTHGPAAVAVGVGVGDGGTTLNSVSNSNSNSITVQQNPSQIQIVAETAVTAPATSISNNTLSSSTVPVPVPVPVTGTGTASSENELQNQHPTQLIRFSQTSQKKVPFFLDLPIFIITVEEIYKILNSCSDEEKSLRLTSPGPSGMLDLYHLYCHHLAGDPHILRTLESIIDTSLRSKNPAALSLQDLFLTAYKKAPDFGQKKGSKLRQFYELHSIQSALSQPFICGESSIRHQLCNIWYREAGTGPLRKTKMCRLYKQYCLHIEKQEKFFNGIFGLTIILPQGPFRMSNLEHMAIMLKSIPFKKPLKTSVSDGGDEDNSNSDRKGQGPIDFDINCNNDMAMVLYIRQDFGVDHQLFKSLPPSLRHIVGNKPVTISVTKLSQRAPFSSSSETSSNIEFMQLCSTSPSSSSTTDSNNSKERIRLKFPSELTLPEYKNVFSWVFLATEVPGIFVIRNEQWNEFLMVVDADPLDPQSKNVDNYEFCHLSTCTDYRDTEDDNEKGNRAKFSVIIQGQEVHIVSCFTNSPIVVDGRLQRAFVPRKMPSKDSESDDSSFNFGLGTVFFISLA